MAHIANLKKRAAALGLTIVKQSDAKDSAGTGYNEYTLAANELDHDNSYMFSLDAIARLIEACESFPAASPDQIKAILVHDNPLKYAGELLRIHKQDQDAMRADIEVGDSVSFAEFPGHSWLTVVAAHGNDILVAKDSDNLNPLAAVPTDKRLVKKVRKAKFPSSATIDCPFNGALKAAVNDGARSTAKRISMERDICFALVRAAIEAGFKIAVHDGEECTIKSSDDFVTIAKALFTTDEDTLFFIKDGKRVGFVYLIYGNDGFDVINDYSTALESVMKPINDYADSLEKEDSFGDATQRLLKAHNESFVDSGVKAALDGSSETVESVVIPECGVASAKDSEATPFELGVKRDATYLPPVIILSHSHDLLCEAALCIWENMLEIRHGKPSLDETWDKFSTVAMRHAAIALAPAACSIWDMMSEDERQECIPYDWEFIPAFVSLVKWEEWIDFGTSALAGGVDLESVKTAILATFQKPES